MEITNNTQDLASKEHILSLFGVTPEKVEKTFELLFATFNHSCSGELAETIVLMKHRENGLLYTVYGSECSVWDFEGQWEPEVFLPNSLRPNLLEERWLGWEDQARRDLATFVEKLPEFSFDNLSLSGKIALYGYHVNKEDIELLSSRGADFLKDLQITNNAQQVIRGQDFEVAFQHHYSGSWPDVGLTLLHEGESFSVVAGYEKRKNGAPFFVIIDKDIYSLSPSPSENQKDFMYQNATRFVSFFEEAYLSNLEQTAPPKKNRL